MFSVHIFVALVWSDHRVNVWFVPRMERLCYSSSVRSKQINHYLNENDNESAPDGDTIHCMPPLHVLSTNPRTPADVIAALLCERE